jgi:predicted RNA binding protein YcfA (HicA-like mRNA interferase family)
VARITPISSERLTKVFEKAGFRLVRQETDHLVYTKAGVLRPVVIPVCKVGCERRGRGENSKGWGWWRWTDGSQRLEVKDGFYTFGSSSGVFSQ